MNKKERAEERKINYERRVEKHKKILHSSDFYSHYFTETDLINLHNTMKITESNENGISLYEGTAIGFLTKAVFKKCFIPYDEKICILNFASFYHPGGGFLKGSIAQEEELCEHSLLLYYLKKYESIYKKRKKDLVYDGYSDDIILSKNVPFFLDSKNPDEISRRFDVISCSAPNYSVMKKECKTATDHAKLITNLYKIFYRRLYNILNIAYNERTDHLIVGAWGCGVFGNNPDNVANIFKDVIFDNNFDQFFEIDFVIPDEKTYNIFENVLFHEEEKR